MDTIVKYQELGLGLFVHFGLYSIIGKGEWVKFMHGIKDVEYEKLLNKFNPRKDWADKICEFAKKNGFKYVVLTSRHHDGFSLYDVKGLNEYDSLHSKCKRDLAQEFVNLDVFKTNPNFEEMFNVVVQLGAILAVIVLFFNNLKIEF